MLRSIGGAALAAMIALAAPGEARAQNSGINVPVELTVLTPLSFIKTRDLDFGQIVPGTTAGTVVLAPDGSVSTTGGVRLATGSPQAAHFAGYGTSGQFVRINLNGNTFPIARIGGGGTMTMRRITINSTPPNTLGTGFRWFRIGAANGIFNFDLGATLDVAANQPPGHYEGTFQVTLEYF